jgi:RNA polymerase sigma-70 factor (ECF subfamily)
VISIYLIAFIFSQKPIQSGHPMTESLSSSLLVGLKAGDQSSWVKLVDHFFPVVYHWCRKSGIRADDARDLCQEVFLNVSSAIQGFQQHDNKNAFYAWLKTITNRRIVDFRRHRIIRPPDAMGGSTAWKILQLIPGDTLSSIGPGQVDSVATELIRLGQIEFEDKTWKAFWLAVIDGQAVEDVALQLGISVNSVYLARSRVTRRLRDLSTAVVSGARGGREK